MRLQTLKPITSGIRSSDRSCNIQSCAVVPSFELAFAKKTAGLRLQIVLRHSDTILSLVIVKRGKKRRSEAMNVSLSNGDLAAPVRTDITHAPDEHLAAILRSVRAGSDCNSKPLSELG
ncbi:MAG: hypothetical protein ACSHXH_19375 [Marivita sp.]|uniref:hypothetical protein n=1 Tax=Marivita sp. TaxID=2003365 RepID=UPI003EF5A4CE